MLPLLICFAAASAANETSIAYYESPSMVSVPQGLRFSTIWTAVQDQTAGFPLQAHRERPHMGRCPLSQGVESLALHTHVSRDTTGTLAPSSASQATPQGAPTRPDGDNTHATCSISASYPSHSLSMSGAKGVLTPQHTTRSRASGHSAHTLSAASADPPALCQRPGGLAVHVGQRPSSPLAWPTTAIVQTPTTRATCNPSRPSMPTSPPRALRRRHSSSCR